MHGTLCTIDAYSSVSTDCSCMLTASLYNTYCYKPQATIYCIRPRFNVSPKTLLRWATVWPSSLRRARARPLSPLPRAPGTVSFTTDDGHGRGYCYLRRGRHYLDSRNIDTRAILVVPKRERQLDDLCRRLGFK